MHIDQRIHKHLDKIDAIEGRVSVEIDRIYASIDIDEVIADPESALLDIAEQLREVLTGDIAFDAVNEGIKFAEETKRALVIPDSDDPKLNKELDA